MQRHLFFGIIRPDSTPFQNVNTVVAVPLSKFSSTFVLVSSRQLCETTRTLFGEKIDEMVFRNEAARG
eukprot:2025800-Rhodomonas_salina.7